MSWRLIRPDPAQGGELPATEFVHPLPLLALVLLAINDHVLKGSGLLPSIATGKISDFAGLFFFPLLLTACFDVAAHGLNSVARKHLLDASLRQWKLLAASLFTAALFIAIKLSASAAQVYAETLRSVDLLGLLPRIKIVQDPSDLLALPAIAVAYYFGRSRLAEIPPARLSALTARLARGGEARQSVLRKGLADCQRISSQPQARFDTLLQGLGPWLEAQAQGSVDEKILAQANQSLSAWRSD